MDYHTVDVVFSREDRLVEKVEESLFSLLDEVVFAQLERRRIDRFGLILVHFPFQIDSDIS